MNGSIKEGALVKTSVNPAEFTSAMLESIFESSLIAASVLVLLNSMSVRLVVDPLPLEQHDLVQVHQSPVPVSFRTGDCTPIVRPIGVHEQAIDAIGNSFFEFPLEVGSTLQVGLAPSMGSPIEPLSLVDHSELLNLKGWQKDPNQPVVLIGVDALLFHRLLDYF